MDPAELRTEAIAFSRYLVGSEPSEELIARYCEANRELFAGEEDRGVVEFARRHPWSIPLLDARFALGGTSLLRKKLLVMMAILETTPRFVAQTEQQPLPLPRLALRLVSAGASVAVHVVGGFALSRILAWRHVD